MATWWNDSYLFRREIVLSIVSPSVAKFAHMTLTRFGDIDITTLLANGATRSDYEDIEILHETADATPAYTVLGRFIIPSSPVVSIQFLTPVALPDTGKVYMYYGNPDLVDQPSRPNFDTTLVPVLLPDDPIITYTRPEEHWIDGESSTANSVATFNFFGTNVSVRIATGPSYGKYNFASQGSYGNSPGGGIFVGDAYSPTEGFHTTGGGSGIAGAFGTFQLRVVGEKNPSSSGETIKIIQFNLIGQVIKSVGVEEINIEAWTSF